MHIVARAHPNIALIKYWGKRQTYLNLPCVGSLSVTLDGLTTETRLQPWEGPADKVLFNGEAAKGRDDSRILLFLQRVRALAGRRDRVRVDTRNDFPTASGLASSASGFAALALAAARYYELPWTLQKLSALAREGSGSASRSLHGGFVEWILGERDDGEDSIAIPLAPANWWDLRVNVAVVTMGRKAIGSREAMDLSKSTSPFYQSWIDSQIADLDVAKGALLARDFDVLAEVSEHSCHKMVSTWTTSRPSFHYWKKETFAVIQAVNGWKAEGLKVFFTTDAGPHVKVICRGEDNAEVVRRLEGLQGVLDVLSCKVGGPAEVHVGE